MKKILSLFVLLSSPAVFSCVSIGQSMICPGDLVYKGDDYSRGAIVVAENSYTQQLTVKSQVSGNLFLENIDDLDVTRGCIDFLCVGDKVLKGSSYSQGATVLGINYLKQTVTVSSVVTGNLFVENIRELESTKGCIEAVCIGDKVFKGSQYSQGAIVSAINFNQRTVTVKSVVSGNLFAEALDELDLTKGCVGNICVNDKVFKGTEYSQGAIVVAVNANHFKAVVKSVVSGNIFEESIYDLQNATNHGPRDPRDPRDPRNPQGSGSATCTVNRLDPAGMFITSYTQSASGSLSRDLKGEACSIALKICSTELRGRQTCNISR